MTSKDFPRMRRLQNALRLWLRWQTTSIFHLGTDEGGIEEQLDVTPEELNAKELLELEQEHTAEKEARERKTGEEK